MKIIGSADGVRSLANGIVNTTKEVFELTNDMKRQLQSLESSFCDSGYSDVQEIVMQVYQSIESHIGDIEVISGALRRYAGLLERKG